MFGQDRLEQTELFAQEEKMDAIRIAEELEKAAATLRKKGSILLQKKDEEMIEASPGIDTTLRRNYIQKRDTHTVSFTICWESDERP